MKKLILYLVFSCFVFVAQGQNFWDMPKFGENPDKIRVKNNKIKRVTIKIADYNSSVAHSTRSIEFDALGNQIKETSYRLGSYVKWHYQYEIKENKFIERKIKGREKPKKNYIDSTVQVQLNDTIQESKFYTLGKLTFYEKIISNKQQKKLSELHIAYNSSLLGSYFEDRNDRDSVIHTKFSYPAEDKIQITSFFNSNKNDFSTAFIYLDSLKRIYREEVVSFYSKFNIYVEYLVIYIYYDKGLLKRKYSVTKEEYSKFQKDPDAKIVLLGYEDYEYNEKGLLIKNTTFYTESFYPKPIKMTEIYEYEYW